MARLYSCRSACARVARTAGPLLAVQGAELNARLIGGARHRAAQGIDFLDQVALADAADGRVAAHLPQRLDIVREQQRAQAHARSRQRGFGAGMAAADHDDLVFLSKTHDTESTRFSAEGATLNSRGQSTREPLSAAATKAACKALRSRYHPHGRRRRCRHHGRGGHHRVRDRHVGIFDSVAGAALQIGQVAPDFTATTARVTPSC